MTKFTDTILRDIEHDKTTITSFVDLTKAFDTVNHTILLFKLKDMGLNLNIIKWLKSYLSNRYQSTLANNQRSTQAEVKCGVPQGSILGPLLFLTYINDIDKNLECNVSLYADDAAIYTSHKQSDVAAAKLQTDMDRLVAWTRVNHLTINIKKTKVMYFGTQPSLKKVNPDTQITMSGQILETVTVFKYLGVLLDGELKYDSYIEDLKKRAGYRIIQLARIRKYMTGKQAMQIFKSKIAPYFDYGDILYHGTSLLLTDRLQRLQNRALKICLRLHPLTPTATVHKKAKINYLEDKRTSHLLKFAFKKCQNRENRLLPTRATRANIGPMLKYVKAKKKIARRSVEYKAEVLWNHLPPPKRLIDDYNAFCEDQFVILSQKRLDYV